MSRAKYKSQITQYANEHKVIRIAQSTMGVTPKPIAIVVCPVPNTNQRKVIRKVIRIAQSTMGVTPKPIAIVV
jgi:hypothetical protein